MGRAATTTLAQLGVHVLGVGRHAERDGVGAEPSGPFPATAWAEGAQVHVPPCTASEAHPGRSSGIRGLRHPPNACPQGASR
jgi:hypothetical protein